MRQCLHIFFTAAGARPYLVLLCLLLAGLLEAIGIGTLLPAIGTLMTGANASEPSLFERLLRQVFETVGLGPEFETLLMVVVVFMVLRSLILFGTMSYVGISGARVANAMRQRFVRAIFDARWNFYANQSGGALASHMSADGGRAGDAYVISGQVLAAVVQVTAYSVIALTINWRVAVLGLACAALIGLSTRWLIHITRKASYKLTGKSADMTSDLVEMLQNIKALKSMHGHESLLGRLSRSIRQVMRALFRQQLARNGLVHGTDILVVVLVALSGWVAVKVAGIKLTDLIILGLFFSQVVFHATKLMKLLQTATSVEASYVKFAQLVEEAETAREDVGHGATPDIGKGLRLENVSFQHADRPTIRDATLQIGKGNITVLQGPSGSGKTTLVDMITGLNRPDTGKVWIGDGELKTLNLAAWRRMVGYVPQELVLFHDTIRANLNLGDSNITDEHIASALTMAGLENFIAELPEGLETEVGEYGSKLSGGQRQRLSLARALVRQPQLLILDEVTSALDPVTEAEIARNITRLRGQFTIVAVTHRPIWTVLADQLYKVDNGRVKLLKTTRKRQK